MSGYKGWFGWWETNLHSWRPKWKEVTFKEPILNLSETKVTISFNGKIQSVTDFTSRSIAHWGISGRKREFHI